MKRLRIFCAFITLQLATHVASGQGVVSQLGGFLERSQDVAVQPIQGFASPLSLLLPDDGPTFAVASSQARPYDSAIQPGVTPAPEPQPVPFAKPKGLVTLRSMKVANQGGESKVYFGAGQELAMGTDSAGNFVVQQAAAAAPVIALDSQDTLHLNSARVEMNSLNAVNGVAVRGAQQWQLVYTDDFSATPTGWNVGPAPAAVTQCGGVFMLGGFCKLSTGEVNKTFTGLPPHKQLRVTASYHFIDRWIGETGYMKLNVGMNGCSVPVWSEQYTQQASQDGLSLCGNADVPEGKFSTPIEVTVPHHSESVTVTFGATIGGGDPCDESYGVSAVEIYVRN